MAHYFPYDVRLRLLADSRSFLANQKARNAIVGAENLLIKDILPHPPHPAFDGWLPTNHQQIGQCLGHVPSRVLTEPLLFAITLFFFANPIQSDPVQSLFNNMVLEKLEEDSIWLHQPLQLRKLRLLFILGSRRRSRCSPKWTELSDEKAQNSQNVPKRREIP